MTSITLLHHKKITYYFLFLAIILSHVVAIKTESNLTPPAIYVFGDSTADVGNNNFLSGKAPKANFPHYGIDFPGGVSTGRFSNGLLVIDFIAKALGFSMSPPPFLSQPINDIQFIKGVNFASAGSGILVTTGQDVISLDKQIENFNAIVSQLKSRLGNEEATKFLANSFFYISSGSNDLFAQYMVHTPMDQIVTTLTNKFQEQLKKIYNLGGRRFAIPSTGLVGCIPVIRALSPSLDCNKNLNDISIHLKNATKVILENLSMNLDGFKYSFGDSFYAGDNPSASGLKITINACCGSGKLNAGAMCSPNTTYCANMNDYYFWDQFHPTETLYKAVAEQFVNGPQGFTSPTNIYKLMSS